MSTVADRVFIPASLSDNNQKIIISRPWYLRDKNTVPVEQSPAILQFRSDSFIDDFFDGVTKSSKSEASNTFEKLLGMRDYSEVPAAMVDVSGKGIYPHNMIKRDEAPANDVKDKELIDEAWLRKLYLTLHEHFHLVTIDISCERKGYPRVDKERVLDSGIIVRRLIPDKKEERWEDWIPVSNEHGIWYEMANKKMEELSVSGAIINPENIIGNIPACDVSCFFSNVGQTPNFDTPLVIQSEKLSLLPKSLMLDKQYTSLFGYLSLTSDYYQAPKVIPEDSDITLHLKKTIERNLTKKWLGEYPPNAESDLFVTKNKDMIERLLLDLLSLTVLPTRPPSVSLSDALSVAIGSVVSSRSKFVKALWLTLSNADSSWGASKDDWWESFSSQININLVNFFPVGTVDDKEKIKNILTHWIYEILNKHQSSDHTHFSTETFLLFIISLVRLKFQGTVLLDVLYSNFDEKPELESDISLAALSTEIQAWLNVNGSDIQMPWAPIDLNSVDENIDSYESVFKLENIFNKLFLRGNGRGFLEYIDEKSTAIGQQILDDTEFGPEAISFNENEDLFKLKDGTFEPSLFPFKKLALDLTQTLELGLFIFSGIIFSRNNIETTTIEIANKYNGGSSLSEEKQKLEISNLFNLVRPRYDSDSLYCVQCFVKIAGRNSCEKDKILWSKRTEPFSIAEPTDILGVRPVAMQLPDLKKMIRDIPRIPKARANPFASVSIPPDSDINVNPVDISDISRKMGIQMICSYGIPVFTICAWILFTIILNILLIIPGFAWLFLLKFCTPVPSKES